MFLNVDQLEKQLDKEEFQEIGSMFAFRSIDERAPHKREYDSKVNERLMQTTERKVDTGKALDASLVVTESNGSEFEKQNTSSSSGNDADAGDADIKPVYDKVPMAEVQLTAESNVFSIGQWHTEQPEFNNEGGVDQDAEQCHNIRPLHAQLTDNKTTELSNQSLEESWNSSKNMPRFSSNNMVHNHYLQEARKKTHESDRNSRPSMMPSARSQSTGTSINVKEEQTLDLRA
nr:hypothetical protein [Tanacetum cinerariifolium]